MILKTQGQCVDDNTSDIRSFRSFKKPVSVEAAMLEEDDNSISPQTKTKFFNNLLAGDFDRIR